MCCAEGCAGRFRCSDPIYPKRGDMVRWCTAFVDPTTPPEVRHARVIELRMSVFHKGDRLRDGIHLVEFSVFADLWWLDGEVNQNGRG